MIYYLIIVLFTYVLERNIGDTYGKYLIRYTELDFWIIRKERILYINNSIFKYLVLLREIYMKFKRIIMNQN